MRSLEQGTTGPKKQLGCPHVSLVTLRILQQLQKIATTMAEVMLAS